MNLRKIRQDKGISAKELASKMAVDVTTISRWETGARTPDANLAPKLADFLGCTLDELLRSANPLSSRKVARRKSPRGSGRKRAEAQLAL